MFRGFEINQLTHTFEGSLQSHTQEELWLTEEPN